MRIRGIISGLLETTNDISGLGRISFHLAEYFRFLPDFYTATYEILHI